MLCLPLDPIQLKPTKILEVLQPHALGAARTGVGACAWDSTFMLLACFGECFPQIDDAAASGIINHHPKDLLSPIIHPSVPPPSPAPPPPPPHPTPSHSFLCHTAREGMTSGPSPCPVTCVTLIAPLHRRAKGGSFHHLYASRQCLLPECRAACLLHLHLCLPAWQMSSVELHVALGQRWPGCCCVNKQEADEYGALVPFISETPCIPSWPNIALSLGAEQQDMLRWQGCRVIELGAGVGLLGIFLAQLGAQVQALCLNECHACYCYTA